MTSTKEVFIGVLVATVLIAGFVYADSARNGSANISKVDYVESKIDPISPGDGNPGCTPVDDQYITIPGMTKVFHQGGGFSNEIVVAYSGAETYTSGDRVEVRLLVDGVPQSGSGTGVMLKDSLSTVIIPWNFVSAPVSPGSHTVELQWRGIEAGAYFCARNNSMVIYHR